MRQAHTDLPDVKEKATMFISISRKRIVALVSVLALALLVACGSPTSPSTGGTSATTPIATPTQPSPTQQPSAYVPGSLDFLGTVQRVSSSNIAVSMPDGQVLVMNVVRGQTDLSHCNNVMPSKGQVIEAHATAKSDGSFTANELAFPDSHGQHDRSQIDYHGVTTSAVGSDLVLHFQVGRMRFSFPISPTTDLGDFNHHAQSIGMHQSIEAHVQFHGTSGTVVEVDRMDMH
jgi:hypothetical protein